MIPDFAGGALIGHRLHVLNFAFVTPPFKQHLAQIRIIGLLLGWRLLGCAGPHADRLSALLYVAGFGNHDVAPLKALLRNELLLVFAHVGRVPIPCVLVVGQFGRAEDQLLGHFKAIEVELVAARFARRHVSTNVRGWLPCVLGNPLPLLQIVAELANFHHFLTGVGQEVIPV